ncbi:Galactokinase [archaeon HR01]|nr:Galactokinase [archaeon HR01]
MRKSISCSAPAKVILFGEHFVVGGQPALVTAVDRRAYVRCVERDEGILVRSGSSYIFRKNGRTVDYSSPADIVSLRPYSVMAETVLEDVGVEKGVEIVVESEIPRGAGLGSSAAVAVAGSKAILSLLNQEADLESVVRYAMKSEKIVHGRPSGIDIRVAASGGTILYSTPSDWRRLELGWSPRLIILDTGVRRPTGRVVRSVLSYARSEPYLFEELIQIYREVLSTSLEALNRGDLKTVGRCMDINHILLRALGVSSNVIERAIDFLRGLEVYGAKLTGAGLGGCVIAVMDEGRMDSALTHIRDMYNGSWLASTSCEGVRVERSGGA